MYHRLKGTLEIPQEEIDVWDAVSDENWGVGGGVARVLDEIRKLTPHIQGHFTGYERTDKPTVFNIKLVFNIVGSTDEKSIYGVMSALDYLLGRGWRYVSGEVITQAEFESLRYSFFTEEGGI